MELRDAALMLAGAIGCGVAVVHGVLTQRLMVAPVARLTGDALSPPIRRLVPLLLHYSTVAWLVGGLALLAASRIASPGARLAIGALVGLSYIFAAAGNAWATRGRHPGWMLMALAVALTAYGVKQ